MKIRVDFVTNSSSSSYVDIYADNPVLNELLAKYNGSADDAYMHYITDFCNEHEDLAYSKSLLNFLCMDAGMPDAELQKEFEEKIISMYHFGQRSSRRISEGEMLLMLRRYIRQL